MDDAARPISTITTVGICFVIADRISRGGRPNVIASVRLFPLLTFEPTLAFHTYIGHDYSFHWIQDQGQRSMSGLGSQFETRSVGS